jgi:hypothetical protein
MFLIDNIETNILKNMNQQRQDLRALRDKIQHCLLADIWLDYNKDPSKNEIMLEKEEIEIL